MHLSKLEHRGTINYSSIFSLSLPPPHFLSPKTLSQLLGIFSGADKVVQARISSFVSGIMISIPKENHRIPNASTIKRQIRTRSDLVHAKQSFYVVSNDITGIASEIAARNGQNQNWHHLVTSLPFRECYYANQFQSPMMRYTSMSLSLYPFQIFSSLHFLI